MHIEQSPDHRVEQHASWISVNPIIGCPYGCEYCFLGPDGLRPQRPTELIDASTTLDHLLESKFYDPSLSVAIGTRTDMFSTPANNLFTRKWLDVWESSGIPNPLVFVTKAEIPEDTIQRMSKIQDAGRAVLVFLSISGLDNTIERGVRHDRLRANLPRLSQYGIQPIHYWRPLMPMNSSLEVMRDVHGAVWPYASSSFIGGLRVTEEMKKQIHGWPEILDIDTNTLDSVWDNTSRENIAILRHDQPAYPLYEAVTCTIARATQTPDRNGMYGTEPCITANCPDSQRAICGNRKLPTDEAVRSALQRLAIPGNFAIASDGTVITDGLLGLDELTNFRLSTGLDIQPGMITDDTSYGWGNHHNRQPVYITSKSPLRNVSRKEFEVKRKTFLDLKRHFAETEKQPWDSLTIAGELGLQVAHLGIAMRGDALKNQYAPQLESVADEFADVIFNLMNLMSFLEIDVHSLMKHAKDDVDTNEWYDQLAMLSGLCWDAVAKKTGYKAYSNEQDSEALSLEKIISHMFKLVDHGITITNISQELEVVLETLLDKSHEFIAKNTVR